MSTKTRGLITGTAAAGEDGWACGLLRCDLWIMMEPTHDVLNIVTVGALSRHVVRAPATVLNFIPSKSQNSKSVGGENGRNRF